MMEGQGHMPPGANLQKCDFCFATFNTLSELICHSCIHAPGNPPNRELYQAQNFLTKANFNNPGFANLDDLARHNRLHSIDKQTYNNFYDSPFTSSSQLNFTQQIPAAHQNIPPAHQQIPTIHTPIFSSDKGYSCNFRDAAFVQQCSQGAPSEGPSPSDHLSFNPELFQSPSFTATKIPNSLTAQKKPMMKVDLNGEPKPPAPRKKRTGNGERNHKCYLCGSAFLKRSHLVEHLPIHTGERPFKCDICGQTFIKKSDLARHNFTHTGQKPFKCDYCDAAYTRKSILRQHVLIHTNEKPFKCTQCIAAFNKKPDLQQHMLIHTGEKPYKCDSCESAFTTKNQLKDHKAFHTGEKLHKCILCGSSFKRRKGLKRHHRIHTGKKPHKCERCEACFVEKSQLKVHMRIHTGEKPFKCDQCGAAFRQKGLLTIHQNIHQGSKQYQCDQCTASFSQKCNLTIHKRVHSGVEQFNQYLYQPSYTATRIQLNMLNKARKMEINEATAKLLEELTPRPKKVHTGEKNHKCTFCDAAFSRKSHLTEHVLIHTGEKPYTCDMCDSAFNKKSDLSRHRRIHTGDKPFKCKQCDASFMRKSNLTQHMYTHTTGKPFKCKYCTGVFMKKGDLDEHQVCHTTMKTYMCEKCDASFTSKQKLKDHKVLHNQTVKKKKKSKKHKSTHSDLDKPFVCKTCGERFHKQSTLTRHNRIHGVSKTFKCEFCTASFEERAQLKKHLRSHVMSKPFQCEQCEASFAQKGQMKFHLKSHEGDKRFKCEICTCSFSRKPSLINHNAMHRQKAQEREYMEMKSEPEDDMDQSSRGGLGEGGELNVRLAATRTPRPTAGQILRKSSSNKRKGFPVPHRPLKKKIKWIEEDEYIKAEIAEEEDEDEDYIVEQEEENLISAEDERLDKRVSDTEDDEEDSEEEEGEVPNDDDAQSNDGDDGVKDDGDQPELNTPVAPGQNGVNDDDDDDNNKELEEQFNDSGRSDEQGLDDSGNMNNAKEEMSMPMNDRSMDNRSRDVGGEVYDKYGRGMIDRGIIDNQLDNASIRHTSGLDKYREANMDIQRSNDAMGDNRYGHLNSASGEMSYASQQKMLMSEGRYPDYNPGPLGGNNAQHGSNMESQKMSRSLWPSY